MKAALNDYKSSYGIIIPGNCDMFDVAELKNVCACVRLALSGAFFDRLINDILPP